MRALEALSDFQNRWARWEPGACLLELVTDLTLLSRSRRTRAYSPTPLDGRHQHHPRRMSQDKFDERQKKKDRDQAEERKRSDEEASPPPAVVAKPRWYGWEGCALVCRQPQK